MILMLTKLQNLGTSRSRSLGIFYELDPDLKPTCEENLAAECNATLETQQNIYLFGFLKAASSRVRQASSSTGKKRGFFSKFTLRKDMQIEQCPQLEELGEEHTPLSLYFGKHLCTKT
jgi:hypothetical protein